MPDNIEKIKQRWSEENRLRMLDLSPSFLLFEKAQSDIKFLLELLESKELAISEKNM